MADTLARQRAIIGTTADWAAHNLVLGDGELALERRIDGIIKAKIGDGVLTFAAAPYLGGALDTPEADLRYVKQSDTSTTGGPAVANKWPRLSADGLLDSSLLHFPAAIRYRGNVDPTIPPPAGTVSGDAYSVAVAGIIHAAWLAPVAGLNAAIGDMLMKDSAGHWNLVPTASVATAAAQAAAAALASANAAAGYAAVAARSARASVGTSAAPPAASDLLIGDSRGAAIDFRAASAAQVRVVDDAIPYSGSLQSFMPTATWPAAKKVTLADGSGGWSGHNLLPRASDTSQATWVKTGGTAADGVGIGHSFTLTAALNSLRTPVTAVPITNSWMMGEVKIDFANSTGTYIGFDFIVDSTTYRASINRATRAVGTVSAGMTAEVSATAHDGSALPAGIYIVRLKLQRGTANVSSNLLLRSMDADNGTNGTIGSVIFFTEPRIHYGTKPMAYVDTAATGVFLPPWDWSRVNPMTAAREQTLLQEGTAATYRNTKSRDFTDPAWTITGAPVVTYNPTGGWDSEGATTVAAGAADAIISQAVVNATARHSASIYLRRLAGADNPSLSLDGGVTWTPVTDLNNFRDVARKAIYRAAANPTMALKIPAGNTFECGMFLDIDQDFVSSPYPTGSVRPADLIDMFYTTMMPLGVDNSVFVDFYRCDFEFGQTAQEYPLRIMNNAGTAAADININGGDYTFGIKSTSAGFGGTGHFIATAQPSALTGLTARQKAGQYAFSMNGEPVRHAAFADAIVPDRVRLGFSMRQAYLRRFVTVPRALEDDLIPVWRAVKTTPYIAGSMTLAKFAEVPGTLLQRQPVVCSLGVNANFVNFIAFHLVQNSVTVAGNSVESPQKIIARRGRFDLIAGAGGWTDGAWFDYVVGANWATGGGAAFGPMVAKVTSGKRVGRVYAIHTQDDNDGPSNARLLNSYSRWSDDNAAPGSFSAAVRVAAATDQLVGQPDGYMAQYGPTSRFPHRLITTLYGAFLVAGVKNTVRFVWLDEADGDDAWHVGAPWTAPAGYDISEPTFCILPSGRLVGTVRVDQFNGNPAGADIRFWFYSDDGGATAVHGGFVGNYTGATVANAMEQFDIGGTYGAEGLALLLAVDPGTAALRMGGSIRRIKGGVLQAPKFRPMSRVASFNYSSLRRVSDRYALMAYGSWSLSFNADGHSMLALVAMPASFGGSVPDQAPWVA